MKTTPYVEWISQMQKEIEEIYPHDHAEYKRGYLQALDICRNAYLIRQDISPIKTLLETIDRHFISDPKIHYSNIFWLWIQDNAEEMSHLEFMTWNNILALARKGEGLNQ